MHLMLESVDIQDNVIGALFSLKTHLVSHQNTPNYHKGDHVLETLINRN